MTRLKTQNIRNVGIIAHVDAGKTTLTERILHTAGAVHRAGSVDGGTTATDFDPLERKKGITISSAAVHFEYGGYGYNLIDTPGHADFTIEVERSLRVLDGAIVLLDAVAGVQPQTEKVWRQADRYGVPRIVFINKLDKPGADLEAAVGSLKKRLDVSAVVVGYPSVGTDGEHRWVDLRSPQPPAGADAEAFAARRLALIEACAEVSSQVETAFVLDQPVTVEMLTDAVRVACVTQRFVPVFAGIAARTVGVVEVLDAAATYLPAPKTEGEDRLAFCFKVGFEKFGQMAFLRVYSGTLRRGDGLWSARAGRTLRIGRLVRLFGGRLDDVEELPAGSIGAVVGGRLQTGDTLSEPTVKATLEGLEKPEAVVHLAIEAERLADRDKLHAVLERMLIEDPSLVRTQDADTSEEVLGGIGQLHLEVTLDRLRQRSGVGIRAGQPKVALRSTIQSPAEERHRHVKRSGGPGQFAELVLRLEPGESGSGVVFEDHTKGGVVPHEFVPGVEKGVREALASGPLDGHPVVDVRVSLLDGLAHSHDSSELAFKVAAQACTKTALETAAPVLLEPVMQVEVQAPDETVGGIVQDLQRRRGRLQGLDDAPAGRTVRARVPLAELFGFAGDLASLSQGRASHELTLAGYEPAPAEQVQGLLRRAS